jgi:hypothetical protein
VCDIFCTDCEDNLGWFYVSYDTIVNHMFKPSNIDTYVHTVTYTHAQRHVRTHARKPLQEEAFEESQKYKVNPPPPEPPSNCPQLFLDWSRMSMIYCLSLCISFLSRRKGNSSWRSMRFPVPS